MTVRDTSRIAYAVMDLAPQQAAIVRRLARHPGMTRREIATALHLDVSAVAGRVNELIAAGRLKECGQRSCKVTGRTAYALDLV